MDEMKTIEEVKPDLVKLCGELGAATDNMVKSRIHRDALYDIWILASAEYTSARAHFDAVRQQFDEAVAK